MTDILLVRHGETEDNAVHRIQGWGDSALSARGREDAAAAGRVLAGKNLEALYCSDLERAAETAAIVAEKTGHVPVPIEDLREIHLGPWEGRLLKEVTAADAIAFERWRWDARVPPYPDIEPLADFRDRLVEALEAIVARHHGTVAVVSHGGAISVLLTHFIGLALLRIWQMPVLNGSISRVHWDGERFFVSSYNETAHLAPRPVRSRILMG